MNIFAFSPSAVISAQQHCDKHVVKMILEAAQMLSTAHRLCGSIYADNVYKAAYENHPCTIWARSSRVNYQWLYTYYASLAARYRIATGKYHKSWQELSRYLVHTPDGITRQELTPFALAMPDKYKQSCPHKSYQDYFNGEKRHIAYWTYNNVPTWWNGSREGSTPSRIIYGDIKDAEKRKARDERRKAKQAREQAALAEWRDKFNSTRKPATGRLARHVA